MTFHIEYQDTTIRSQPAEGVIVCDDRNAALSAAFNLWRATNMHVRVTSQTRKLAEYFPEQPADF